MATHTIVQKLIAEYTPQQIISFGDVLVVVKRTSDRSLSRWRSIQQILIESLAAVPVEILVFTPSEIAYRLANADQFIAEILENGTVLYEAS
jgi:hypothetical protein